VVFGGWFGLCPIRAAGELARWRVEM